MLDDFKLVEIEHFHDLFGLGNDGFLVEIGGLFGNCFGNDQDRVAVGEFIRLECLVVVEEPADQVDFRNDV